MSEIGETSALLADRAASLLFSVFVRAADAGAGMEARDVQSLNLMLERPDWTDSPFLRAAQVSLRARYFDLWRDYQKGGGARDLALASQQLNAVLATPGAPPAADVRVAIERFLDRQLRNASPTLLRLGLAAVAPARRDARAEIDRWLLAGTGDRAIAAPVPAPTATAKAAAQPPLAISAWPAASWAACAGDVWRGGRLELRCAAVIPETSDVRTYVFAPAKPMMFVYEPGQFVTLALPIEGKTVRRSYTMSSSPSRPHAISITVKRVPGGVASNWLHDNMSVDAMVSLTGPHGMFSCFNAPAPKLLMLAAGSGITPIMSMLRWLVDTASAVDVVLIDNIRTPADVIFARELAYLGTRMGDKLTLGIMPAAHHPGMAWNGPVGHLGEPSIRLWAPDFAEREVFICGPSGYMKFARETLERMGSAMTRYHEESFGAPAVHMLAALAPPRAAVASIAAANGFREPAVATSAPAAAKAPVEVVFSLSGKTATAEQGDFLLDLAEQHDVAIASGCRSGNCGTCKVVKIEGEVVMEEQTALSAADIADGYILTCVGRAQGEKVILRA